MPMHEHVVASVHDLSDGEMKQVSVGDTDLLLARLGDDFHALHAYCTHYGGPLAEGVLSDGCVVCPWHHARFDLKTGDHLEPPGLDALPRFDVRVDGEDVVVSLPEEVHGHRTPRMAPHDESADARVFAVLGAGAAGAHAVEAIRQSGFKGRLVLITQEEYQPYDRPNCSKEYLQGEAPEEWMFLRSKGFYLDHGIELMEKRRVSRVDVRERVIAFEEGWTLAYDKLLLCTGGRPRRLDVPGVDLKDVFLLRSYDDARSIHAAAEHSQQAVVVGASFIGMEVAWSLRSLGLEVTVVAPEEVPFAKVLGERVGGWIRDLHREHGVRFKLGRTVKAFEGADDVERVVLDDGEKVKADLVVIGIGVTPVTDYLEGVERKDDGSVAVDEHLRVADGVYAAGDIATFPDWRTGASVRIEHWRLACQHGRVAGLNMAGEETPYRSIPFFWTAHFGKGLRYVGHAAGWDEVFFDGEPGDEEGFVAFYAKDGRVLAAAGSGRDRDMAALEELMRRDRMPSPEELKRGVDLVARLK